MGTYARTYSLTDGTVAYGSQVAFELDALGSSVNNIVNAQIAAGANIADTKLAQITTGQKVHLSALVGNSQAEGDLIYASSNVAFALLAKGVEGQLLKQGASLPAWAWGGIVQQVETKVTSAVNLGTLGSIPVDDTTPLFNEGTKVASFDTTITPKNANNILIIEIGFWTLCTPLSQIQVALFKDPAAAGAAIAAWSEIQTASHSFGSYYHTFRFGAAGGTSATTFKLNLGGGIQFTINGDNSGNRIYGGVAYSFMRITEIAPAV